MPAEDEELRRYLREFEPITDLRDYAFVFAQKGYASPPVIWLDAQVNVLAVANALRAFADQIERAALNDPHIPDSDWEKAGRSKPRRPRWRTRSPELLDPALPDPPPSASTPWRSLTPSEIRN